MTSRVGAKGQVVIPKELRRRAGLHPGSSVEFELAGDAVKISPAGAQSGLGGRFADSGMADRMLAERARERR